MRKIVTVFLLLLALTVGTHVIRVIQIDSRPNSMASAFQQFDLDRMAELQRIIREEIGAAGAKDLSQCRSIAFGHKPCGGPATYLPYSVAKTDESKLKTLVDEYNQQARNYNNAQKSLSNCMYLSAPKIELVDGVCKLAWNLPRPIK
jgi:hypothetical protein